MNGNCRVPFWERWTTRLAVVVMLVAVIGGGGYANLEHAPPDTTPDVRGLLTTTNGSPTAPYPYLPPLPGTADGRGWHPVAHPR
jgi:hypothetical protein